MNKSTLLKANNFDFLRFFAATLVLISHSYALYGGAQNEPIVKLIGVGGGELAVWIFFIISGFLITSSYDRNSHLLHYIKNRFLRIFPALAFTTLITVFIIGPTVTTVPLRDYFSQRETWEYFNNFTILYVRYYLPGVFTHNFYPGAINGSLWTLPQELMMYICIPIFAAVGLLSRRLALFIVLGFFIIHFKIVTEPSMGRYFLPVNAFHFANLGLYFFSGAILYLYFDKVPLKLSIFICLLLATLSLGKTSYNDMMWHLSLPYLIIFLAYYDFGHLRNFGKYGDFSYGIYVFAFPVQQFLSYYFWPTLNFYGFMLLAYLLTLVMAFISWHLVEEPALRLKNKFWNKKAIVKTEEKIKTPVRI